jgi:hypothetical protein
MTETEWFRQWSSAQIAVHGWVDEANKNIKNAGKNL